jgi:hypothetical protein
MNLMDNRVETRLSLIVVGSAMRSFCVLTGGGFQVDIQASCTLRELLCARLGIESAYLESRIQTIFLNYKAVDDPKSAIVSAGATIALSGPMPGIAGAMLRKGSPLSSMRSPISHDTHDNQPDSPGGDVTIRLFNVLQQELGPRLLDRGIRIPGSSLADLLRRRARSFESAILTAELDEKTVSVAAVLAADWSGRAVHLRVIRSATA